MFHFFFFYKFEFNKLAWVESNFETNWNRWKVLHASWILHFEFLIEYRMTCKKPFLNFTTHKKRTLILCKCRYFAFDSMEIKMLKKRINKLVTVFGAVALRIRNDSFINYIRIPNRTASEVRQTPVQCLINAQKVY